MNVQIVNFMLLLLNIVLLLVEVKFSRLFHLADFNIVQYLICASFYTIIIGLFSMIEGSRVNADFVAAPNVTYLMLLMGVLEDATIQISSVSLTVLWPIPGELAMGPNAPQSPISSKRNSWILVQRQGPISSHVLNNTKKRTLYQKQRFSLQSIAKIARKANKNRNIKI